MRLNKYVVDVVGDITAGDRKRLMAKVDIAGLLFDKYQRAGIPRHKLNAKFDISKMPPLVCNLRDGGIYCLDGLQRYTQMLARNITQCFAVLYVGMSFEDEASLFFDLNDIPAKMNGWTKFYAAINAGSRINQLLLDTVHSFNLTVPRDPGVNKAAHADLKNVAVVLDAFALGAMPLVKKVCRVLSSCFRVGRGGPVQETAKAYDFCRGMMQFLHESGNDLDWTLLIPTLRHIGADGIRDIARHARSKGRIDAAQIRQAFGAAYRGLPRQAA